MSLKRIFPERGTYDMATSIAALQKRCDELTSSIKTPNMADLTSGYNTKYNDQPEKMTSDTTSGSLPMLPTTSSFPMRKMSMDTHEDAIMEEAPTNVDSRILEIENGNLKGDDKTDSLSSVSKSNKCENCIVNCLYYSNKCCDCTIV